MPELSLAAAVLLLLPSALSMQVPSTDPALDLPPSQQIHVDQRCRVLSLDRTSRGDTRSKPVFRLDPGVCHLENQVHNSHVQETVEDGVLTRTRIDIYEATFVLTNPTARPVVFIVDQTLPRGWQLDSQLAPDKISEGLATFQINARAGQTVQLRVGMHD